MMVSVVIDKTHVTRDLLASRAMLPRETMMLTEVVSNSLLRGLKRRAPKKTGVFAKGLRRYRAPVRVRDTTVSVDIVAGGKHGYLAPMIIHGTRPHEIRSSRPMPMVYDNVAVAFSYRVSHPGTAPNPFIDDTIRSVQRRIVPREMIRLIKTLPIGR